MSRAVIPDLWDEAHAAGLDEPDLLLYRSNLLGSDLRVTSFGGGGASAKVDVAARLFRRGGQGAVGPGICVYVDAISFPR